MNIRPYALRAIVLTLVVSTLILQGCSTTGDHGLSGARGELVTAALSQIGTPYRLGGNSPREGLDCSGLTAYAHRCGGAEDPAYGRRPAAVGQTRGGEAWPGRSGLLPHPAGWRARWSDGGQRAVRPCVDLPPAGATGPAGLALLATLLRRCRNLPALSPSTAGGRPHSATAGSTDVGAWASEGCGPRLRPRLLAIHCAQWGPRTDLRRRALPSPLSSRRK